MCVYMYIYIYITSTLNPNPNSNPNAFQPYLNSKGWLYLPMDTFLDVPDDKVTLTLTLVLTPART